MAPRLTAAIAVGAATCIAMAACGDGEPQATAGPAGPASYVAAVQGLVEPPGLLAREIARSARDGDRAAPARDRLERLVAAARERLAGLRALRLEDASLRRRRDDLASAYARLVPRMRAAADALATGDRAALVAAATPFLDALRRLPSDAAASSSPSR
jgi:hypothetical protein